MNQAAPGAAWEHDQIQARLLGWLNEQAARVEPPLFVGLDGRSGSGKSTLAAAIARQRDDAVVIEGDQFYAGGSAQTWDERSIEDRAARVIDWQRQRRVLQELSDLGASSWQSFDWDAVDWDGEPVPLLAERTRCVVAPIILLEGAYSCRPELHDVLDLRALLAPPVDVRRGQLLQREGDEYRTDWEARWSEAEDHYFGQIMPPQQFDLVLQGG